MPILHLSQLIGVAAGLEESELKFKRHVVSVKPVLEKLADLTSLGVVAGLLALAAAGVWRGAGSRPGWVRLRVLEVPVAGLPPELDGLRIAHLSDFHLGVPSRGVRRRAARCRVGRGAAARTSSASPATCSRAGGRARARSSCSSGCRHPYVVLGNHDFALSRDPFSRPVEIVELDARRAARRLGGRASSCAGAGSSSPASTRARGSTRGRSRFADSQADLRLLLCHFPRALDRSSRAGSHLILAGHLHAGQIVLPYGFGRLLLAHPRVRARAGDLSCATARRMHVSPGLGTTFVPFRFFARPEATELVYDALADGRPQRHLVRVLARYAADAALEVAGVRAGRSRPRSSGAA